MEPVEQVNALFADSAFLHDPETTERSLAHLNAAARKTFSDQFTYVVNSVLLDISDSVLQRKLDFSAHAGAGHSQRRLPEIPGRPPRLRGGVDLCGLLRRQPAARESGLRG